MRILILGAGALGGYFGGRFHQAGLDPCFLVRPGRAAQLARDGLSITSPLGNYQATVTTIAPDALQPGWDLILLTCKAYDLPAAMDAIRPAVDSRSAILPVLNGIRHIKTLQESFGPDRVLGGLAKIQASLAPDGAIRHLNDWRWLTFGEIAGGMSERVERIASVISAAPGMVAPARMLRCPRVYLWALASSPGRRHSAGWLPQQHGAISAKTDSGRPISASSVSPHSVRPGSSRWPGLRRKKLMVRAASGANPKT